jgi:hypothetical protein
MARQVQKEAVDLKKKLEDVGRTRRMWQPTSMPW